MKDFFKKYGFSILLYGLLGLMLAVAGIGATERPIEFFTILGLVVAIDITSFKQGLTV